MLQANITKRKWEERISRYLAHHPIETLLLLFPVLPLGILSAVTGFTVLLVSPVAVLFGWF